MNIKKNKNSHIGFFFLYVILNSFYTFRAESAGFLTTTSLAYDLFVPQKLQSDLCRGIYDEFPAPQRTSILWSSCSFVSVVDQLPEVGLTENEVTVFRWFFLPYSLDYVYSALLMSAEQTNDALKEADFYFGSDLVIRDLTPLKSPTSAKLFRAKRQKKISKTYQHSFRTRMWYTQVFPYRRDLYAVIERLEKTGGQVLDFNKLLALFPAKEGTFGLHKASVRVKETKDLSLVREFYQDEIDIQTDFILRAVSQQLEIQN